MPIQLLRSQEEQTSRELGIAPNDLRLVIVSDDTRHADHEVLAVHYGQKWLILDNLTMSILDAEQIRHYHPLFVMDFRGVRWLSKDFDLSPSGDLTGHLVFSSVQQTVLGPIP